MLDFEKNEFVCDICNRKFDTSKGISGHIRQSHKIKPKLYYDKYIKKDKTDGICKLDGCNNETFFRNLRNGYRDYCSQSCANLDEKTIEKKKMTYFNKTGYIHNMLNPDCIKKHADTCIEKYGSPHYFSSKIGIENNTSNYHNKSDEEKENRVLKIKNTKKEKYGSENYCNTDKIKETKLERYGNSGWTNSQKMLVTKFNKYGNCAYDKNKRKHLNIDKKFNKLESSIIDGKLNIELLEVIDSNILICKCLDCNNTFEISDQMYRIRIKRKECICNVCHPYRENTTSYNEDEIAEFLTSNNIIIIRNDRKILNPFEIDILLPDDNIGIEYNGVYTHSGKYKPNNYHLMKTKMCDGRRIHLIHIYEDDWNYKKEIVKSRLLNLVNKSNKIYARKCEIKNVNIKDTKEFLINNHIQGFCNFKISLGLYYNNELISLMTFGHYRRNLGYTTVIDNEYELLRFCNKLNNSVVGGADKLFKHFIKNYNPNTVISYADRSWTTKIKSTLYDKLNFKFDSDTDINYYYVIGDKRENRFKYRKSELVKQGFDKNKTEKEIMSDREIFRIYDSGSLKYVWNKEI